MNKVNESRSGWTMIIILELQYLTTSSVTSYHTHRFEVFEKGLYMFRTQGMLLQVGLSYEY